MATLGFGQRTGQIVQTAYVVPRMGEAIDWWVEDGKAGPFFLLDSFTGPEQLYRGAATGADVSIAMGFAGHMMIELIQPKDTRPSVYKDLVDRRGYGFHHVGIAFEDVKAERREYERRGYRVAFCAPVPSGGSVYYMEDGGRAPGFVELIPATPGMDDMFTRYWRASLDWNGERPIRPFG